MANERLILAIGQLERALTRMEAAHARLAASSRTSADADETLNNLAARHHQLKVAAADALNGIDAILAGKKAI